MMTKTFTQDPVKIPTRGSVRYKPEKLRTLGFSPTTLIKYDQVKYSNKQKTANKIPGINTFLIAFPMSEVMIKESRTTSQTGSRNLIQIEVEIKKVPKSNSQSFLFLR